MTLLIVDDDKFIIDGIMAGIHWENFNFEKIYTARGYHAAINILKQSDIDIMVCDIEMPQGSGLDLLQWSKVEGMDIETIFLTSFADFGYAQRAIKLGSINYLLKPITFDLLEQSISQAIVKVEKSSEAKQYNAYGKLWLENQDEAKQEFWMKMIRAQSGDFQELMADKGSLLGYSKDELFLFLIMELHLDISEDRNQIISENRNQIRAILNSLNWREDCLLVEGGTCGVLVFRCLDTVYDIEELWQLIMEAGKLKLIDKDKLSLYFSKPASSLQWKEELFLLRKMRFNNLRFSGLCNFTKDFVSTSESYQTPDINRLELLFKEKAKEAIYRYYKQYLTKMAQNGIINEQMLYKVMYDVMQLILSILKEEQIEAHELFDEMIKQEYHENSVKSSRDMLIYLKVLTDAAIDYMDFVKEPDNVIDKVIQYIDQHLEDNITRNDLANQVFLNPDYLSRLFKRRTSVSIINYITNRKMEAAKKLLITSVIPVYEIALKVGYPSTSFFAKQFKKTFGYGPNELRTLYQEKNACHMYEERLIIKNERNQ